MVTLKCDVRTCITKKTAAARAISVSVVKVPVTVHRHAAIPLKKQRAIST